MALLGLEGVLAIFSSMLHMDKPKEELGEDFKHIVRIGNADLDGKKQLLDSLRKIKGISFTFANAVCEISQLKKTQMLGKMSDSDIKKAEEVIQSAHLKLPQWILNRRRNIEDNSSAHLVTTDLSYAQENDIRQMKKIKSYRGLRHMTNSPVRGQRTKSNFRRNKGKVLGVAKSKSTQASKKPQDDKKK